MAKTIFEYNEPDSSGFQTVDGSLSLEVFAQFTYAVGDGASTNDLTVPDSSMISVGDSIYIAKLAAQTVTGVPDSTSVTLTTAVSWSDNDAVVVKRETGQGTDDYATIYDSQLRDDDITQTSQAFTSDAANKWRFFIDGRRVAVRVADSDNATLQLDQDIVFNTDDQESAAQALTGVGNTIVSTHRIIELTSDGNYLMASVPTIAAGYANQRIRLINVDTTNTIEIQDDDTAAGTTLELTATSHVLSANGDNIELVWNDTIGSGRWVEISSFVNLI